jgi:hypothetical protein
MEDDKINAIMREVDPLTAEQKEAFLAWLRKARAKTP